MPRITHAAKTLLGAYGDYSVANSADLTTLAADPANDEQVVLTGRQIVIARNSGAGAHTVTFTSVASPATFGRSGNIAAYSLGAGELAAFGPFELTGWIQTDGRLYFEADDAEVIFSVITIP